MNADRATPDLDAAELLRAGERLPAWQVPALLGVILLAILLLLAVPAVLTYRNTALRAEISGVLSPLSAAVTDLELATSARVAAARGYALAGDEAYRTRLQTAGADAERAVQILEAQIDELPDELASRTTRLLELNARWSRTNVLLASGAITRETFTSRLDAQDALYQELLDATAALQDEVRRASAARRATIEETERLRTGVTMVLALIALLAGSAALWLGWQLATAANRLRLRAAEEAMLLRMARISVTAEAVDEALQRILESIVATAGAAGGHLEQLADEATEIVVTAVAGAGAAPVGSRAPYGGSLTERVFTSQESERTSVAAMAAERRPASRLFAKTCATCELLAVPLLSEDEPLGTVVLYRPSGTPFTDADARRTRLLADMASLVVRRLSSVEELQRSERALRESTRQLEELSAGLEERVRDRTEQVRALSAALVYAEQRERNRISALLHDHLQQVLYALQLNVKALRRTRDQEAVLAGLESLASEATETARGMAVELSPPVLRGEGLVQALRWLAVHAGQAYRLRVEIDAPEPIDAISMELRVLLFHTVRDLLFEAAKDGGSGPVRISVRQQGRDVLITAAGVDLGPGRSPSRGMPPVEETISLTALNDRLGLFGGRLEIHGLDTEASRITIRVPSEASATPLSEYSPTA